MKRIFFFISIFVVSVSSAQQYTNIYFEANFPDGMEWIAAYSSYNNNCGTERYVGLLQGDTTIQEQTYQKLIYKDLLIIPIRNEGKKIYARIDSTDILLYDFGLEVGDSIAQYTVNFNEGGTLSLEDDKKYVRVQWIDSTMLLDGRMAKQLHYNTGRSVDIEYIGSETSVLSPLGWPPIPTCYDGKYWEYGCSYNGEPIYESHPGCCISHDIDADIAHALLIGNWQVYQDAITEPDGGGGYYTYMGNVDTLTLYSFTEDEVYKVSTDGKNYSDTKEYTIENLPDGVCRLTINSWFDPTGSGWTSSGSFNNPNSPISIYKITENEIIWAYTQSSDYSEGNPVHIQHLRRYTNEIQRPASATTWYGFQYYHSYPQEEYTPLITNITYNLGTDTLIDDKQYRQIRYTHEYENITNAYRGAIRQSEDRQQVYYVPSGSHKEYLLYNFNVKQGDTVYAYFGFWDISCEEQAIQYTDKNIMPAWNVLSVQTIDGRKHISVQNGESGTTIEWIEGVGTRYILWPIGRTCYATGMEVQFHHALCAADSEGNILYSYDTDYLGIHNKQCEWEEIRESIVPIQGNTSNSAETTKVILDGQILILRGNKTYTIEGQVVNDGL